MHSLHVAKMKSQLQINLVTELVQNKENSCQRDMYRNVLKSTMCTAYQSYHFSEDIAHYEANKLKS